MRTSDQEIIFGEETNLSVIDDLSSYHATAPIHHSNKPHLAVGAFIHSVDNDCSLAFNKTSAPQPRLEYSDSILLLYAFVLCSANFLTGVKIWNNLSAAEFDVLYSQLL
jgi:hypothetical protein